MEANSPAFSIKNPRFRRLVMLAVGGFLAIQLTWFFLASAGSVEQFWIGNISNLVSGTAATLFALETRRWLERTGQASLRQIQVWNWIAAGIGIWTVADLIRMLLERFAADSILVFAPLDLIHLDGSLAILVAILLIPRKPRENIGAVRLLLDVAITNSALITLAWVAIFAPVFRILAVGDGMPLVLLHSIIDLIFLLILVNLVLLSQPGSIMVPYGWIGLAFGVYAFSDLVYGIELISGQFQAGSMAMAGWIAGDSLMIAAALVQIASIDQKRPFAIAILARFRLRSILPLLTTVMLGLYTVLNWGVNNHQIQVGLWITAILGLALVTRQGLVAGEVEFQQYSSLVNSVAVPTFVCDRRGILQLTNPALLAALGESASVRGITRPLHDIVRLPQPIDTVLEQALRQGWSGESVLRRADGKEIPVTLALRPINAGSDFSLALAGTAHDLTEYKLQQAAIQSAYEQVDRAREALALLNTQLEEKVIEKTASLSEAYEQLEEQNRKLHSLDQMKSDFVSLVSHELRAPLTNINGGIELVLSQPYPFPPRVRSTLDLVQAEIQRLTRFTETILDLSALEAGRTPIYPAPVHLETIITRLKNQMRHLPDAGRVRWNIPQQLPFLMADEQALTSVLFHLLDNAMKYAPDGQIIVSAGVQSEQAWVQVADEGPGIPVEALPFLFTRFYRSRASDAQTVYGHGLGLYIVQRLMQAMQGSVEIHNRPEGGAAFTCWLPMISQADETAFEAEEDLSTQSIGLSPLDLDE